MTAQQVKNGLQGQGVGNIIQTVIAAGILWMCATLNGLTVSVAEQGKDLGQHERRITALEVSE